MLVLSNTTAQTLAPGQSITFDAIRHRSGNGECCGFRDTYRDLRTTSARMRCNGVYLVAFSGNIGATAPGAAQIAIQNDGATLLETTMISQTAEAGNLNNVSTQTRVRNCCGDNSKISVTNTGTTTITIGANTSLVLDRRG